MSNHRILFSIRNKAKTSRRGKERLQLTTKEKETELDLLAGTIQKDKSVSTARDCRPFPIYGAIFSILFTKQGFEVSWKVERA